jgi:alkylation response protein AidB-like acyl-CoA dehydrogenase
VKRQAFGKLLVDHEGVGFMLAENLIDLQTGRADDRLVRRRTRYRCSSARVESSMAKVAVSEALMRVADRCVQVMGGKGVSGRHHRGAGASAKSVPSASMTARPRSTNGRSPRRSSATTSTLRN